METVINTTTLRAELPRVLQRVQRGERSTVLYRSREAFRIVPTDAAEASCGDREEDPLYQAGAVERSSDGLNAGNHDQVQYNKNAEESDLREHFRLDGAGRRGGPVFMAVLRPLATGNCAAAASWSARTSCWRRRSGFSACAPRVTRPTVDAVQTADSKPKGGPAAGIPIAAVPARAPHGS